MRGLVDSQYYTSRPKVSWRYKIQKRLPEAMLKGIHREVNRQRKISSPSGASYNPNSHLSNIDLAFEDLKLLDNQNSQQLTGIRKELDSKTPPPFRRRPSKNLSKVRTGHTAKKSKLVSPLRRSLDLPKLSRTGNAKKGFKLYKHCIEYIDAISDYIKHEDRRPIEDMISMRIYDKRINHHCIQESLRLKQEMFHMKASKYMSI